jgi:hypothetical protein
MKILAAAHLAVTASDVSKGWFKFNLSKSAFPS